MKISIITPSYCQTDYIEKTIQSVLSQASQTIEYIIIDGGSKDGSVEKIKKYATKLAYWTSEKDNGQSHAINKGVVKSTGDVINWLNSDDYYEDDALKIVQKCFSDPKTKVLIGRSRLFNAIGTLGFSRGTDVYTGNLPKTIGWARIDQPETFFRNEAWNQIGHLNESLHYCMDREWWMRYLYHFGLMGIKIVPDILVNFRIHENSKTASQQKGFLKEHHSLFYQMGRVAGANGALDVMAKNLDINTELVTSISNWTNVPLCKASFNYYLLKSADEFYAQDQMDICKDYLKMIDISLLQDDDKKLFNKLRYRSKLPLSIIHLFRNR